MSETECAVDLFALLAEAEAEIAARTPEEIAAAEREERATRLASLRAAYKTADADVRYEIGLEIGRIKGLTDRVCGRCRGTGHLPQFDHIANGDCFACDGTGDAYARADMRSAH